MSALGAFYRGLTSLVEPAAGPLLAVWARGESSSLRRERLGRASLSRVDTWWHAASLGEVAALEPVLVRAMERNLTGRFVVTNTSAAGRARADRAWPGRASLAPLDIPGIVRRALERRSPRALILVETELWPNWLEEAERRSTPVAIVNGRISDKSWPRYRRWASLFRPLLTGVKAAAVQTQKDAERFTAIGIPEDILRVVGNTKHDRLEPEVPAGLPWTTGPVWTVGSLRPGEETPVLDAFRELHTRFPEFKLVLVPRHPDLWPHLDDELIRRGLRWARKSRPREEDSRTEVLVVDGQGELPRYYAAADMAFVGGTLVPIGGHNVLEAAGSGIPVLTGPHVFGVIEEARALENAGALVRVQGKEKLVSTLDRWIRDPGSRQRAGRSSAEVVERFRGGSDRALDWLVERDVLRPETTDA